MRTTSVLVGVVFGVLSAGLLSLPLAVELPARALAGWAYVSHEAALVAFLSALAMPFVAGFSAALFDRDDPVWAGAGAALVGGLLCGVVVVMPASLVAPATSVLRLMHDPGLDELTLRSLLADMLVGMQQGPALAGAALLPAAASLGAVGGLVQDLWQGSAARQPERVHRSSVPLVGSFVVLFALTLDLVWSAHADVTLLPALGHPLTWAGRARWTSPIGTAALAQSFLLAWMVRDALLLARAGRRFLAGAWGALALVAPALTTLAVLVLHPLAATTPAFWLALPTALASVVGALVVHWSGRVELHDRPRTYGELVGEGTLMGVSTIGLACLTGLSPVVGAAAFGYPLVHGLLGVTPEPDPRFLVGRLFLLHLATPFLMAAVAGGYGVLATPTWLLVRGSTDDRT